MSAKSRPYPTGRKAIRKAIKKDYRTLQSYDKVGSSWGISGGLAWKFVNEKNYWPTDPKIKATIWVEAYRRKIPLGNRGGKDLHSMSKEELTWRLQNREVIHDHNQDSA